MNAKKPCAAHHTQIHKHHTDHRRIHGIAAGLERLAEHQIGHTPHLKHDINCEECFHQPDHLQIFCENPNQHIRTEHK